MKTTLLLAAILSTVFSPKICASEQAPTSPHRERPHSMVIDPKQRAFDYKEAFDLLKKEKAAHKVCLHLIDGSCVSNIIDLHIMSNSTLFLVHFNTPQGIKTQAIELEMIRNVGYLE